MEIASATFDLLSSDEIEYLIGKGTAMNLIGFQKNGALIDCMIIKKVAIGFCLVRLDQDKSVHIGIHPDYRKQGYAMQLAQHTISSAFKKDEIDQLNCEIKVKGPAVKLVERLGFKKIGSVNDSIFYSVFKYDFYRAERIERQRQYLIAERERELLVNATLIKNFIERCNEIQINLVQNDFDYIQTIGIVAKHPNLLGLLNNKIRSDKEELVDVETLEKEFKKMSFAPAYYYGDHYVAMAHPYFRRGYSKNANFAPMFLHTFDKYKSSKNRKYIAIDFDRVRVNVDNRMYMEFDTWFGAKFKMLIEDIEDGIVKLRPPAELDKFDVDTFFGGVYSLDIKWTSKNGVKVFQAEEFKLEDEKIIKNGIEYYPVKYVHAEFEITSSIFRHLDGAIHFYTEDEYFRRRDEDFNYNSKNASQIKTISQKLFKINGEIAVADWIEIVSHFLTGNPLVHEYFEGQLPEDLVNTIKILMNSKSDTSK